MRTLLAVAVTLFAFSGTASAQLFRGRAQSSGGCANGSCSSPGAAGVTTYSYPTYSLPTTYAPQATYTAAVGDGHTHTCPKCGTTWDHSTNPGHNCPRCGTFQNIQDPVRRTVTTSQPQPVKIVAPPVMVAGGCTCGASGCVGAKGPAGSRVLVVTFIP